MPQSARHCTLFHLAVQVGATLEFEARRGTVDLRAGSRNLLSAMTSEPDLIHEIAERILAGDPDPAVRFRLLRDVLARPPDGPALVQARHDLSTSRWVQELEREQREDGSWGRFRIPNGRATLTAQAC